MRGKTGTTTFQSPRIDPTSHALQIISDAEHHIHEGHSFFFTDANDLGNGAVRDVLLVTPDTAKFAHLTFGVSSEAEINVVLYEATTTSADGAAISELNRDRNSATVATMVATSAPTVTAVGTLLLNFLSGSGRASPTEVSFNRELILKRNTKYMFRITNATSNANGVVLEVGWYEHTDFAA